MKDAELVGLVGIALSKLGVASEAERYLARALRTDPRRVAWRFALAEAYFQGNRLDEAVVEFDRVIAVDSSASLPVVSKAAVLERRGDYEAVRRLVGPHVDSDATGYAASILGLALAHDAEWAAVIDLLGPWVARPMVDARVRMSMCRTIARAHEHTGSIEAAFDAISEGNRLCAHPHTPEQFEAKIDDLIATYSPQNMAILARASNPDPRPVFIASMPRSGSTLVEQIIHAHPRGFGAGEITDLVELVHALPGRLRSLQEYPDCLGDWSAAHADAAQRWYLDRLATQDRSADRVVNKHLDNWMHLGLVRLALPGARVIHVTRDPMDNGFSIFMAAMNSFAYPWSTDLAHIGHAYRMHTRMMRHWHEVFGDDLLVVPYEQLIADPDRWIRRIIGFLGLDWDDACLAFHTAERDVHTLSYDQVRRPIYSSAVGRWRKYESLLAPLRSALADPSEDGSHHTSDRH